MKRAGVLLLIVGQSRVGLQGTEALIGDWSAVFQIETFFNPQSGEIADSLKSLTVNNGRSLTDQTVGVDGSSAGQAFQTAWIGFKSARFGTLTFGRQTALLVPCIAAYTMVWPAAIYPRPTSTPRSASAINFERQCKPVAERVKYAWPDVNHLSAIEEETWNPIHTS